MAKWACSEFSLSYYPNIGVIRDFYFSKMRFLNFKILDFGAGMRFNGCLFLVLLLLFSSYLLPHWYIKD